MRNSQASNPPLRGSTFDRAAHGDETAFARLVSEHHGPMAKVAFVICGDADLAADATQNAWAIAWHRLDSVREPDRLGAWLVAIAANEARQAVRRRGRQSVTNLSAATTLDSGGDPAESMAVVDLQRALTHLTPDERRLLALRFVARLDSNEIAEHLRLPPRASAVASRVSLIGSDRR